MDFMTAVRTCFNKYATFEGTAHRPEFWWFALFVFLGQLVLGFIDTALLGGTQVLSGIFGLAVLLPNLAVGARRLHDVGRSGWWLLLVFLPVIGFLVLLWWFIQPAKTVDNAFA